MTTETCFPTMNEFYNKFCTAVKQSGTEQRFLKKWGLDHLTAVHDILKNNVQGGFSSHKVSILSGRTSTNGPVLSIGPGMGFCLFLLAEVYDTVFAAEPDGENCSLLQSILHHYPTAKNKSAGDIVTVLHAGISITEEAAAYWDTRAQLMKKRKMKGSILNFDIKGAVELSDIFDKKVSRVYLHKVLSSLSIAAGFADIISQCQRFLTANGELTWSEPDYIFSDILQVPDREPIDTVLKPVFEEHHMTFGTKTYEVVNEGLGPAGEAAVIENWVLIKAWR